MTLLLKVEVGSHPDLTLIEFAKEDVVADILKTKINNKSLLFYLKSDDSIKTIF